MIVAKILIRGAFEDAYAYMGRLHVLTQQNTVRALNLEVAAAALEKRLPYLSPAPTFLFARNDWLASGPVRAMLQNSVNRAEFMRLLGSIASDDDRSEFFSSESEFDLKVGDGRIVDLEFYSTRLYVATTRGVFDLNIHWDDVTPAGEIRKRLDARCFAISAAYSAINASCGADGLFSAFGEFTARHSAADGALNQLAERSVRTGWAGYDMVNYATNSSLTLLETQHEAYAGHRGSDRQIVVAVKAERPSHSIFEALRHRYDLPPEMVQYVFNSRSTLFINAFDQRFLTVGLRWGFDFEEGEADLQPSAVRVYEGVHGRVLRAMPTKVGVLVETADKVWLFSEGHWLVLHDGPAINVRTFPASKRYKNLVTITTEEGVWLITAIQESTLTAGA